MLLALACLFKALLLLVSNAFSASPWLIVLLSSVPVLIQQAVFLFRVFIMVPSASAAATWPAFIYQQRIIDTRARHSLLPPHLCCSSSFPPHPLRVSEKMSLLQINLGMLLLGKDKEKGLQRGGKLVLALSGVLTFFFPLAMLIAGSDDKATQETLAIAGAYCSSATSLLISGALLVSGVTLAGKVELGIFASHQPTNKPTNQKNKRNMHAQVGKEATTPGVPDKNTRVSARRAARLLRLLSIAWCLCFACQVGRMLKKRYVRKRM